MERDEAAKAGLQRINKAANNPRALIQQHGSDRLASADALDLGIQGRVAFYSDERLVQPRQGLREGRRVISVARATKDALELACIRQTCRLTISETRDYLQDHRLVGETLCTPTG